MKRSIGVISNNFFQKKTSRYNKFQEHFLDNKKRISVFWDRINFVYAFPFAIIKRTITNLKKTVFVNQFQKNEKLASFRFDVKFLISHSFFPFLKKLLQKDFLSIREKLAGSKNISVFNPKLIINLQRNTWNIAQRLRPISMLSPYNTNLLWQNNAIKSPIEPTIDLKTGPDTSIIFLKRKQYFRDEKAIQKLSLILKETTKRVVEKEETIKRIAKTETISSPDTKPFKINIPELSEQILQSLERRIRIERERRGL